MSKPVKIFTAYDPPPQVREVNNEPSLTRESEAQECDVNFLMARYQRTGVFPQSSGEPQFLDVSEVGDFRQAMETVREGQAIFAALPARVRREFGEDPVAFLEFAEDPANRDRMVELGLLDAVVDPQAKPKVEPAPEGAAE